MFFLIAPLPLTTDMFILKSLVYFWQPDMMGTFHQSAEKWPRVYNVLAWLGSEYFLLSTFR